MMKKNLALLLIFTLATTTVLAQNYERYKKLKDTTISSANLGFKKNISVIVPIEWQETTKNKFPVIIIFDKQNKRSNNYIINTIDYLTSNEQIPAAVIISVASEQRYRYNETQYKISDPNGLALENEKFVFEELIPLAEKEFNASAFRLFIGHSRYGYFTTSLFNSRINDLNAVISLSPFLTQTNIDLTTAISALDSRTFKHKKYYRFGIGNDYPADFAKMDSVLRKIKNPFLSLKGSHFKEADHNVTPGLITATALYEIFEDWSNAQAKYISNEHKDLKIKSSLEQSILANYGVGLNFSIGVLNGKGWHFYNEKQFDKAIEAWQILLDAYPNFSEAYLYIIETQVNTKQNYAETVKKFNQSLANSNFYKEDEKKNLQLELKKLIK